MEQWVELFCYDLGGKYAISSNQRIKTLVASNRFGKYALKKERIRKQYLNKEGYSQVSLYNKNNELKTYKVHRLMAWAFVKNPDNKPFVNHLNSKRHDNRPENLEWCTNSENQKHSVRFGNFPIRFGESALVSKLKEKDVFDILKSKLSKKDLAKKYCVHKDTIENIFRGKTWSEITGILPITKTVKDRSGSNHYLTTLSEKDVVRIYKSTESAKSLAKKYGIGRTTIYAIRRGQNWRHLTNHKLA